MKLLEEGLKLARELDDQKEIANCQERMGAHLALSDAPRARQLKREAIELFRSIDDKKGLAQALFGLSIGWADHEERLAFAEESLALYREVGLKEQIAQGLMYIAGMVYNDGEDDDRAYVMHEEVRDICHEIGVSIWEASAIRSIADISERRGEANRTAELREQADRIHPEDPPNPEFMAALEKAAESSDNEAARQALGKAFFGKKP